MDSIIRAVIVYLLLLVVFRIAGKRSLAQITTFDFVLLLVIAGAVRPALAGTDDSMLNSLLLVMTLVSIDIALSIVKGRSRILEKLLDDVPLVLVEDGQAIRDRMAKVRINERDVLAAA